MTAASPLVACGSCSRDISTEANACPACGAPNKWLHPKIEAFLSQKDATGVAEPFTFKYEKLQIWGQTEKQVPRWISWSALFVGLLLLIPIALLGSIGLAFGPISVVAAAMAALVVKVMLYVLFARNKTFHMDYGSNTWRSSDDAFWLPVKKLLAG